MTFEELWEEHRPDFWDSGLTDIVRDWCSDAWNAARNGPPDVNGSYVSGVHYKRGDDDGPP
jgi:hypothetical protein